MRTQCYLKMKTKILLLNLLLIELNDVTAQDLKPNLVYNDRSSRYKVRSFKDDVRYDSDDEDYFAGDFRRVFDLSRFDDPPLDDEEDMEPEDVKTKELTDEPIMRRFELVNDGETTRNRFEDDYDYYEDMRHDTVAKKEVEDNSGPNDADLERSSRRDDEIEPESLEDKEILKVVHNGPKLFTDKKNLHNVFRRAQSDHLNNQDALQHLFSDFGKDDSERINLKRMVQLNRIMTHSIMRQMESGPYRRSDREAIMKQLSELNSIINKMQNKQYRRLLR